MKKSILFIAVVAACLGIGVNGYKDQRKSERMLQTSDADQQEKKSPEISYMSPSYVFDHEDLEYYIRFVDYVFEAEVQSVEQTDYENKQVIDGKEISTPYTWYKVKEMQGLKGTLKEGQELLVKKLGGLSEDGNTYFLCENDLILQKGNKYVFMGFVQKNGELLVAGENSTIESGSKEADEVQDKVSVAEEKGDIEMKRYKLGEDFLIK